MEQRECQLEEVIFRNEENGYTVAVCSQDGEPFTAVGMFPELAEGSFLLLTGEWKDHPVYGNQFAVSRCVPVMPKGKEALIRYLSSGLIYGVGESTATRIVDTLGEEALDIIRYDPERLLTVPGIGPTRAEQIRQSLEEHMGMQEAMMFLQSLDLGNALSARIYKAYGDETERRIREDPYRLIAEIDGIGFRTADRIALILGVQETAPGRVSAAVIHVLKEAAGQGGHMYLPREPLIRSACELLECGTELIEETLPGMLRDRSVVYQELDEEPCFYLPAMYAAENECAYLLMRLATAETPVPLTEEEILQVASSVRGIELSDEQLSAVTGAVQGSLSVITGGPGTGKTTVLDCLLTVLEQCGIRTELAAPTGRASKRMSQACGRPARTLHRLLEYNFNPESEVLSFQRDSLHPLDCGAVVIDETSMVDIYLLQHLLEAVRPGTKLILIGDADQLPSVGPGRVLRDLTESGTLPVFRLTTVFRQALESRIIVNAHRVNHGEMPLLTGGSDFFFERQPDEESTAVSLEALISKRIPGYLGCDPLADIQVLAPMKRGALGVQRLNERLQNAFNPPSPDKAEARIAGGILLREGDKIIQNRNDYEIDWVIADPKASPREGKGVFNGDIGFVRRIDTEERLILLEFDDGRYAQMDYQQAENLTLAYAISIHKSQGSEFPVVLLPLFSGPPMLMTRNLLYTALTRAKRMAVILGSQQAVARMVRNDWVARRYSGLRLRLQAVFAEYARDE